LYISVQHHGDSDFLEGDTAKKPPPLPPPFSLSRLFTPLSLSWCDLCLSQMSKDSPPLEPPPPVVPTTASHRHFGLWSDDIMIPSDVIIRKAQRRSRSR
jgi:hypothetical protein